MKNKFLIPVLFLSTSTLFAQSGNLLYQWNGETSNDRFGDDVSNAGDVNADGHADLIVGAYWADPGGLAEAGSAYVYSGADGSLFYQWNGESAGDRFGVDVSGAGDVNADGFADVIVGSYHANPGGMNDAGSAFVYSGLDGSLLFRFDGSMDKDYFGTAVSEAGDLNLDGYADVTVGAPWHEGGGNLNAGSAYVFSGADGSLLFHWTGESIGDLFGNSVSNLGDINGDFIGDVIVGADSANLGLSEDVGTAYVFSGADGALLYQGFGVKAFDYYGRTVSGVGDLNGDGLADFLVGSTGADPQGVSSAGSVFAYSGASGLLLHRWDGEMAWDYFSRSVSGAGDLNQDGFPDVVIGANFTNPEGRMDAGSAYAFSGADGALLMKWNGEAAGDKFGNSVSGGGDVDGDGFPDVIIGAYSTDPNGTFVAGTAYVYLGGNFRTILVDGLVAGGNCSIQISGANPGDIVYCCYSLAPATTWSYNGLFDLKIGSNPNNVTILGLSTANNTGKALFSSLIPLGTSGIEVGIQAICRTAPISFAVTSAIQKEIE